MIEQLQNLSERAQQLLDLARSDEQLEIYISKQLTTHIRIFNSEVEQLNRATEIGVALRLLKNTKEAFAHLQSIEKDDIEQTLSRLRDQINYLDEDPYASISEDSSDNGIYHEGLYSDSLIKKELEEKIELAKTTEKTIAKFDKKIAKVEYADYDDSVSFRIVANTNGLLKSEAKTRCFLSASAIAEDSNDSYSAYEISFAKRFEDLDASKLASEVARKAINHLNAIKPKSGVLPVIFSPKIGATFLSLLTTAFSAEALFKNMSFFKGCIDEQVSSPIINIYEDPLNMAAYNAAYFDAEGSQIKSVTLIKDGVLKNFLSNLKYSKATGVPNSASAVRPGYSSAPSVGPRALYINPTGVTFKQILNELNHGILIDSVIGVHSGVNPVSGDFSVGAHGFEFIHGEITKPLKEFTVASTLGRMLLDISHVSQEEFYMPYSAVGRYLAFEKMAISGT